MKAVGCSSAWNNSKDKVKRVISCGNKSNTWVSGPHRKETQTDTFYFTESIGDLNKSRPKGASQARSRLSLKYKGKMTPVQMFCCLLSCGRGQGA